MSYIRQSINGFPVNNKYLGLVFRLSTDWGITSDGSYSPIPRGLAVPTFGRVLSWREQVNNILFTVMPGNIPPTLTARQWREFDSVTFTSSNQILEYVGIIRALEGLDGCSMYMVSGGTLFGAIGNVTGAYSSGSFSYQIKDNSSQYFMGLWSDYSLQLTTVVGAVRNNDNGGSTNCNTIIGSMEKQISVKCHIFDGTQSAQANRRSLWNNNVTKSRTDTLNYPTKTFTSQNGRLHPNTETGHFLIGALGAGVNTYTSIAGNIFEIRIYNRTHNAQERQQVYDEINNRYGLERKNRIICDGDSITLGFGQDYVLGYPCILQSALGTDNWFVQNIGVGGQKITDMLTDGVNQVDSEYNAFKGGKDVVICNAGTNDISGTVGNATTTYNNIVSYCTTRRAVGFKVLVGTILPRTGSLTNASYEADRQTINSSIRANWNTFADGICDWGNDPNMGQAGQANNSYYNGDGIHPSPLGYYTMATTYALPAVNTL